MKRESVYSVGNQIGMGKESDILVVASSSGTQHVLKIHRLGRISFRTVKANRDYLKKGKNGSWMYMSKLAAMKEFAFMTALGKNGFPVPKPLAQSRHTIVMSLIDAFPLRQISSVPDPATLYEELMAMILRLAQYGLIHGDFNEFNILVKEEEPEPLIPSSKGDKEQKIKLTPILIDFPQMVSIDHPNAEYYFDRDVNCVKRYFQRRFHFNSNEESGPHFADARKLVGKDGSKRLDVEVEASGFSRKMAKELEAYMKSVGVDGDGQPGEKRGDEEGEEEDEEEEEDGEEEEEEEVEELQEEIPADVDLDPYAPKDRFGNTIVALSEVSLSDKT